MTSSLFIFEIEEKGTKCGIINFKFQNVEEIMRVLKTALIFFVLNISFVIQFLCQNEIVDLDRKSRKSQLLFVTSTVQKLLLNRFSDAISINCFTTFQRKFRCVFATYET